MDESPPPRFLLALIMAAVFMVSAEARVISPLLPAIAGDFKITIARTGLLITAYTIPYGLFQLVYGPLADRFSRQRVMGTALGFFALGTFISGFAPTILSLDLLRLCTGAAAAGVIPVALAYVGDAVPYVERQAALGRIVSIASLGGVMSAALGGTIATFASWRAMFIGYGVVALCVAVVLLRQPVRRSRAVKIRQGLFTPYVSVFQQAGQRAVALYGLVFIEGFVATSTLGYLGALLYERDGFSYAASGGLLTISGITSMLLGRIVGRLVLRFGERGMLRLGGGAMALGYMLAALQPVLVFFPLAMILMGGGYVMAHSTLQTRATELVPERRGTAVALFAFSLFLSGGLGTFLAGLSVDTQGYTRTLIGTAAALVVFAIVSGPLLTIIAASRDESPS